MVEAKHSAVLQYRRNFHNLLQKADSFLYSVQLFPCAAANSMNVVLQGIRGSLVDHDNLKAVSVVGALCYGISLLMGTTRNEASVVREQLHLQLNSTGLVSALSRLTEAAWQSLQQFISSDRQHQYQQQQQQQQHEHEVHQENIASIVIDVLGLWQDILLHNRASSTLYVSLEDELPALISLTIAAPPLLKKAKACVPISHSSSSSNSNSGSSLLLAGYDMALREAAVTRLALADYITTKTIEQLAAGEGQRQQQQQQKIYLTEKLPELLLQLLAYRTGQLHTACGGVSQAMQDRIAAADDNTGQQQGQQQQQQQQRQRRRHFSECTVPSSHLALLQALGMDHVGLGNDEECQNMQAIRPQYAKALNMLWDTVMARGTRAARLNSGSPWDAGQQQQHQQHQQQQQQQQEDVHSVLPSHLLVPTAKVLTEVVLLLQPSTGLAWHVASLQLILVLLHMPGIPAAAAAAPTSPWPKLPAAVAAGLLQPVVAHLPQAVMYCLLQTDHKQDEEVQNARLALLHFYGCLLITVCQPVEPRHIAAVLKSQSAPDLLITLAAIEAVIRAQACHLAPESEKQRRQRQRQRQQQPPEMSAECSTSSSTASVHMRDILQHPQDQAAVLLLPFASKIALAVANLMQDSDQQRLLSAEGNRTDRLLRLRLFTLMSTVLKQLRAAGESAATLNDSLLSLSLLTTCPCTPVVCEGIAAASSQAELYAEGMHFISRAVYDLAHNWWLATQNSVLPAVLLFGVLRTWSCGVIKLVEHISSTADATAALHAATLILIRLDAGAAAVVEMLQAMLAGAVAEEEEPLRTMAAAAAAGSVSAGHESATAATEPGVPLQQQQGCSDSVYPGPHHLGQLLPKGLSLRTAIRSALETSLSSVQTDALVYLDAPQGQSLATPLHLADMLRQLCEAVLADCPLDCYCNNPACTNLTKLSEWQLVCGKACVCAGCHLARYCSKDCQKQHWQLHRPLCRG